MPRSVHTPAYTTLRQQLRLSREAAGLSQRDLAKRLRVPHSWVAKVETGERRIDVIEFCWFLIACGVDPTVPFKHISERVSAGRSAGRSRR